jgi:DNA-binding beta-propeller fold protein YncE
LNYVLQPLEGEAVGGFAKSRVLEIPLDGASVEILTETDTSAIEPWVATKMALAAETIVAEQDFRGDPKPLTSISLSDGTRKVLTPGLGVWGLTLAPALDVDRVYVATFEGVDEVDLTVPKKRNISPVAAGHALTFSQPRSIGFDPANNRVLVGDDDLEAVIAIDLTTGKRSPLVARNVGEGTPLISPRALALTADGDRVYVADDASNAPARFFEIDLATGNRTEVGNISTAITELVTGLALDESAGRAYIAGRDVVIAVNLETGSYETVLKIEGTALKSISNVLLDAQSGTLFIADAIVDGIFGLDLTTRKLRVISQEGARGTGPAFDTAMSMTRVGSSNQLYVAGQHSERITRVDLETGNREELVHNCPVAFGTLTQVLYDEGRDALLISGDRLLNVDFASGQCTEMPRRVSTLQMQITPADQMIAVWFRALLQIDRETGEVVIISK